MFPQSVPDKPVDRSRRFLIYALSYPASVTFTLQHFGSYFEDLPARLGRDEALDAVVECFITSYAHRQFKQAESYPQRSLELLAYGTAVKALRKAMALPLSQDCEETLCAALLLYLYEFFLQRPTVTCVTLAGGVTSIFQAWGPSRIISTFTLAIFEAHFISMISHALFFGTECFLATPDWATVFQASPNLSELEIELWRTIVHIPQFLSDVRESLSNQRPPMPPILQRGDQLRLQVLDLEHQTTAALSEGCVYHIAPELYEGQLPVPPETPSDVESSREIIFQVVFARAALIMINSALRRLHHTNEVRLHEAERASEWCFRTMALAVRLGPVNGSFCTLAGAAAFGLSDASRRERIAVSLTKWLGDDPQSALPAQSSAYYAGLQRMYNAITGGPIVDIRRH